VCDYSESQKEIREFCVRLLTRREHSKLELLNKLELKGFDRADTALVVDALADNGWQSNQRFAESYARYRIKKGFGPIKIKYELLQRGIEATNLDEVASEIAEDWNELLMQVYKKKYSNQELLTNKEWLSRTRFLQQRGFSTEMIKTLFDALELQINYFK
jgi:regulatory protein